MSNVVEEEIIIVLDDIDDETIESKIEKEKKESEAITILARGIRNGGWLR
jgi:hypothetical protein